MNRFKISERKERSRRRRCVGAGCECTLSIDLIMQPSVQCRQTFITIPVAKLDVGRILSSRCQRMLDNSVEFSEIGDFAIGAAPTQLRALPV